MPDEDDDERLTPEQSKCYTCRYGLCTQEKDLQTFFQPGKVEGNTFESQPDHDSLTEVTFPTEKVRSACYWRPLGMESTLIAPVVFSCVTECSRYEKTIDRVAERLKI